MFEQLNTEGQTRSATEFTQHARNNQSTGRAQVAQMVEETGPRVRGTSENGFLRCHVCGLVLKTPVSVTRVHLTG